MTSKMDATEHADRQTPESVSVLVIGATLTGIGLAYAGKERTLVVERTSGPGPEWIPCFHPGERLDEATASGAAGTFRQELVQRNLLAADNRLHLGALAPVLFNRIRVDGLRVRFLTEVVKVEREKAGRFSVTLFDASGLRQIKAQHIVDTTSTCLSSPDFIPEIRSKKINAMLHCTDPQAGLPVVNDGNAEIIQGRFPGEVILKLRIDPADDWPTARSKLHRYWAERPDTFGSWTMAIVADAFEMSAAKGPLPLDDRRVWLPSCAYGNVLQAFDAGFVYGEEGIPHETVSAN